MPNIWREMDADHWRVMCEFCDYAAFRCDTRQEAIIKGHLHIQEEHEDAPEYGFRIQGIKIK